MAVQARVDDHLRSKLPGVTFTSGTNDATFPSATLTHAQIQNLLDVARLHRQEVVLVAGVLTVKPA